MRQFITIPEIIASAKEKLSQDAWNHAAGAAGTETTLRRNRAAIYSYAFKPRVLRDVSQRSMKTQLLGHTLEVPVLMAPVGSIARYHPDGARAVARVAGRMGTIGFKGGLAEPSLEEVIAGASGPMFYQLYVRGDRTWLESVMRQVEGAGYAALCITVDSPATAFRDRTRRNQYRPRPAEAARNSSGAAEHPDYQGSLTWEDIEWIRSRTTLPLILKGVMHPDDAMLAVDHGVDVVYVSSHGGRELDHGLGTMDVLEPIVQAVAGRAEVIVDSGFLRGTDILKGIALGASAVGIGKLMCWALAADGDDGLQQALEILREEMYATMAMIGVSSLSELGPEYLTRDATPVAAGPILPEQAY